VLDATERTKVKAKPVTDSPASPWLIGGEGALAASKCLIGPSDYSAAAGITTWLDGVFQVEVEDVRADGLVIVTNCADIGRTKIPQVKAAVEADLLFPYVPWDSLLRWSYEPKRWLLVPQDPTTRLPYPESDMRIRWPQTYAYLKQFEELLRGRSGYRQYFKPTDPFYAIYNVNTGTVGPWKTAWRTMSATMDATVVGLHPGASGPPDKPAVFKNTVIFVRAEDEDEGWYLAALLNSPWLAHVVRASNVRGGKSSNATNVLTRVAIPKFDRGNVAHLRLAALGKQASGQKSCGDREMLDATEAAIAEAAAEIWKVSKSAAKAMREALHLLA